MDSSFHQYTQTVIQRERKKILFQYVLTLFCALLAGAFFASCLTDEYISEALRAVAVHFELVFFPTLSSAKALWWIVRYSLPDLICGGICFLFSFSAIHCLVSDLLLIFYGFVYSFSLSLLFQVECSRTPAFANGGYFFTFLFFRLSILVLFTLLCIFTSFTTMTPICDLRTGRYIFPVVSIRKLTLSVIAFSAAVLILTGLYTLILYCLF